MDQPVFLHLGTDEMASCIHQARQRVLLCMPGVSQALAAAAANAARALGPNAVTVVLDVDDKVARYGYGEFEAVAMLVEERVNVRQERGLRACVLIVDNLGFAFSSPPMLVESQDEDAVGVNALALLPAQVDAIALALGHPHPTCTTASEVPLPQIGAAELPPQRMDEVRLALESNPPQKFDLARKVNVFNAFIEFVELRLIGLHIGRYTVQLPKGLGLALRDDATARRLLTTFKLVSEDSKVAKDAVAIDKKVRQLRELYTRPLGERYGSVMLRSKRAALELAIDTLRKEIAEFQAVVVERLEREIDSSRKKLVDGLWQAVKKSKPTELEAQVSGPITSELAKRYVDMELAQVFPDARSLVGEMRLEFLPKGVTYEVLNDPEFLEKVRQAFPLEDFDRPFKEFEAAPSMQPSLFSFGGRT